MFQWFVIVLKGTRTIRYDAHSILYISVRDNGGVMQIGAQTRNSVEDGSFYASVDMQVPHPDFNPDTEEFDYAAVKLGGWVSTVYEINRLLNTNSETGLWQSSA